MRNFFQKDNSFETKIFIIKKLGVLWIRDPCDLYRGNNDFHLIKVINNSHEFQHRPIHISFDVLSSYFPCECDIFAFLFAKLFRVQHDSDPNKFEWEKKLGKVTRLRLAMVIARKLSNLKVFGPKQ